MDLYVYQVEINIPEFFHSTTFPPRNQPSKFALWPCPPRLAEFLGFVTNDVKVASKQGLMSAQNLCNKLFGSFLGYRYLVEIPHDFLPLGNHSFYG